MNANLQKLIGLSAAVLLASLLTTGASTKRPHELVRQARKHHDIYTRNAGPDRQEALHLYQLALEAEPNHDQRFNILYAMARLVSTPPKGQEPTQADLRKAIELYTEIADSFPPEKPQVFDAMLSAGRCYVRLSQFENALECFKRPLQYDIGQIEKSLEAQQQAGQNKLRDSLENTIANIKRHQEIAVDRVADCASQLGPLRAHGELRTIAEKYAGTFIAQRAAQRLLENMDRMPELWSPRYVLPNPSISDFQPALPPTVKPANTHKGTRAQSDILPKVTQEPCSLEPNTKEQSQKDNHAAEPRAPPLSCRSSFVIIAAGLIILGLAVAIIRKRT